MTRSVVEVFADIVCPFTHVGLRRVVVDELRELVAPEPFTGFEADALPSSSLPALALAAAAYNVSDAVGEHVSLALRDAVFEEVRGSPEFFLDGHGWFCPALRIEKVDGRLEIELSRDGFESFLAQCFT